MKYIIYLFIFFITLFFLYKSKICDTFQNFDNKKLDTNLLDYLNRRSLQDRIKGSLEVFEYIKNFITESQKNMTDISSSIDDLEQEIDNI